jgi:hypothetical protein
VKEMAHGVGWGAEVERRRSLNGLGWYPLRVGDDMRRSEKPEVPEVVISGPFMKIFPCNHSVNINIIIFFFRRSKRQRNFSLFYFASQES